MDQPPPVPDGAKGPAGGPDSTAADEPQLIDDAEVIAEAPPSAPPGLPNTSPPPVPAADARGRTAPPPNRPKTVGVPSVSDIPPEDQAFIERAFTAVKDIDFRAPPPPPPRGLSGVDKKLSGLRENVRRLERDLARIGYIWRIKLARVEEVDAIIKAQEDRRAQSDRRYEQITDQAKKAAAEHKQEIDKLNRQIAALEANRDELEDGLRQMTREHAQKAEAYEQRIAAAEQQQQAYVADVKKKMTQAEVAFNQLREQSAGKIGEWEATVKDREEQLAVLERAKADETAAHEQQLEQRATEHAAALAELGATHKEAIAALKEEHANQLGEIEKEREAAGTSHRAATAALDAEIEKLAAELSAAAENTDATQKRLGARLGEREATIKTLTEEMAAARNDHRKKIEELRSDLDGARRDRDATQKDLAKAEKEGANKDKQIEKLEEEVAGQKERIATLEAPRD